MKFSAKAHVEENKRLDWCELAYKIMTLETELYNLMDYLDNSTISQYLIVIDDCENEKSERVAASFDYPRFMNQQNAQAAIMSGSFDEDMFN